MSFSKSLLGSTLLAAFLYTIFWLEGPLQSRPRSNTPSAFKPNSTPKKTSSTLLHFRNHPLDGPNHANQYGDLGRRLQVLSEMMKNHDSEAFSEPSIEEVLLCQFPFLRHPSNQDDPAPLEALRNTYVRGSKGIVIPTGSSNLRFASHLLVSLRKVLGSELPVQIAYAGDEDLSGEQRDMLKSLVTDDVEFLNVLDFFDDTTLDLTKAGWSMKPFAVLASKYEQVILLDADTVFFQRPEVLLEHPAYKDTGALFFHDRLLWQHGFRERHDWWRAELAQQTPSQTLMKSLVWTEDYAEEADSGVVVMDKSRPGMLLGLLHICWQNRVPIRTEVTYRYTYGDKETWWFGLELSGIPYSFSPHYGAMVGYAKPDENDSLEKVCSFTISHVDENDVLLWLNGSLLKNKAVDLETYEVPTHWMLDATWEKGGSKPEMSCTAGKEVRRLSDAQTKVFKDCVEAAKIVDRDHAGLFGLAN